MKQKTILAIAAMSGALSVAVGAFGAHGLRDALEAAGRMETFETAVKYHFYHTLALLAIGILAGRNPSPLLKFSAYAMMGGIIVFSGSLYILSLTNTAWWGAVTPFGGLLFITGWILLAWAVVKGKIDRLY